MTNIFKRDELRLLYQLEFLDRFEVISFDIFDTLLIRDTDTHFKLWKYRSTSFACERTLAEIFARFRTRLNHVYEIKHRDIYKYMHSRWNFSDEIQLEDEHLYINPEILGVIQDLLSLNKRVILISDTHFEITTLQNWLTSRGLPCLQIITSNEFSVPKSRGLFERVKSLELIDVSGWLHIGDNEKSDYQAPRRLGLSALHYPKLRDQVIDSGVLSRKAINWMLKKGSIGNEAFVKLLCNFAAIQYQSKRESFNSLQLLGVLISAPIANSIAKQIAINHQTNNDTEYWFVSRDGWLPYLAFRNRYPERKARYFKTSRKLLGHPNYDDYVLKLIQGTNSIVLYDLGWRGSTLKRLRRSFPDVKWYGEFFELLNKVDPPINVLFRGPRQDFLNIWRARDMVELIFSDQSQSYISLDRELNPIANAIPKHRRGGARLLINKEAEVFINNNNAEMDMAVASLFLTGFVKYPTSKLVFALKDEYHEIKENQEAPLIHSNWKCLFSANHVMWPQATILFEPKLGQLEQSIFKFMCLLKEIIQRTYGVLRLFKNNL